MLRALVALLLVASVPFGRVGAQPVSSHEAGRPYFVQRFTTEEYGLHDQNWAVVQDRSGVVYVANTYGILAFDGKRWEAHPVPNETARSLAVDRHGRVYAGLVGDLGYLESDPWGRLHYRSLLPHVPEEHRRFADVWTTHALGDAIYFQTFERLFRWDGERMYVWATQGRFHKAFAAHGQLYVREEGAGLKRVEGDVLVSVPGGESFADERIDVLLPHGANGLLIGARDQGFLLWGEGRLQPFPTEADAYLEGRRLYHGAMLRDSSYALTTIHGSVLLMDQRGAVQHVLSTDATLRPDDLVLYAYQDHQGGLWLALNDGLLRVDAPTQLSVFSAEDGLGGTVLTVLRHQGVLNVSTTSGLYRLQLGETGARAGFSGTARLQPVGGIGTQSWATAGIDDDLLVAENAGVFVVEGETARRVSERKTFVLKPSVTSPSRVYAGLKDGVELLERRGGAWRSAGLIEGIQAEVRSLVEGPDGALWIGTLYDGVLRVELDGARAASVEHFGVDDGLGEGPVVAMDLHGAPAFLTQTGVYRLAEGTDEPRFVPMSSLNQAVGFGQSAHIYITAQPSEEGDVWVARDGRVERYKRLADGAYVLRTPPVLQVPGLDVRTVYLDPDGVVWVGTDSRLLRYDPRIAKDYAAPYQALVRRVTVRRDSLLFAGAEGEHLARPELRYRDNSLHFTFSAPTFNAPELTQYQYWLEGFDEGWSAWGSETRKEYTNLPEADYRFHVRARNAQGIVSQAGVFAFEVRPPWYRTWWAYSFYALAFAGVVWGTGTIRVRHQARELERQRRLNEQLEHANARLHEANERLHRADQLKDDVLANTSHELRTPLTSILGFASVLEEELHGENRQFAGLIRQSGQRLLDTVNALLEMASLQADLLDLEPEPFDLAEAAATVVERLRAEAEAKGLYLTLMPHSAQVPVRLDRHSVERILATLVGNAVKFTHEGGVTVLLDATDEEIRIVVRDTGIGISETFRPALFGAFQQASSGYGRTHEGTGLGLAIVHRIVQLLGGEIDVESPEEGGTAFRVRLPRFDARAEQAETALLHREVRVLVVEAEERPLHRLRLLLQSQCQVVTAVGAEEALQMAQDGSFDLLVIDGHLPVEASDLPLLARLRALPGVGTVPALAVTSYHLPGDREQFLALGFDDHLAQPVSRRRLAVLLESLIETPVLP